MALLPAEGSPCHGPRDNVTRTEMITDIAIRTMKDRPNDSVSILLLPVSLNFVHADPIDRARRSHPYPPDSAPDICCSLHPVGKAARCERDPIVVAISLTVNDPRLHIDGTRAKITPI